MSIAKGVALVTGSAQGIGRSIALRLARDGFDIALNDLSSKCDQLRAVATEIEKIGRRSHLVPADVSIEGDVKEMVQSTAEALGGLDAMIANAGVGRATDLLTTGLDDWEQIMSVNARGTFLCYKHAAAQMITQGRGGRIIGASSVAGKVAQPLCIAYSSSKFAIRALTQIAALELGRHKITVNAYAPGFVQTALTNSMLGDLGKADKDMVEWIMNNTGRRPLKHGCQPEDIASIVSYLASKEAHFITGQCISVDGGTTMS